MAAAMINVVTRQGASIVSTCSANTVYISSHAHLSCVRTYLMMNKRLIPPVFLLFFTLLLKTKENLKRRQFKILTLFSFFSD